MFGTFVVFDTETSLVSKAGPDGKAFYDLVELGAVAVNGETGDTINEFCTLVRPALPFNADSCHAPHISAKILRDAPTYVDVIDDIIASFSTWIPAGQNVQFDRRVISMATEWYGSRGRLTPSQIDAASQIMGRTMFDTRKLFMALTPERGRSDLDSIAEILDVSPETREKHNALDDARLTVAVLMRLLDMAREIGVASLHDLQRLQDGLWGQPEQEFLF